MLYFLRMDLSKAEDYAKLADTVASHPDYVDIREQSRSFDGLMAYTIRRAAVASAPGAPISRTANCPIREPVNPFAGGGYSLGAVERCCYGLNLPQTHTLCRLRSQLQYPSSGQHGVNDLRTDGGGLPFPTSTLRPEHLSGGARSQKQEARSQKKKPVYPTLSSSSFSPSGSWLLAPGSSPLTY